MRPLVAVLLFALVACRSGGPEEAAVRATGGDPKVGKQLVYDFGCGSCHTIPGVPGARGEVGPPLEGLANRRYLAGQLPNTPDNLVRWILDPQSVDPRTAMPNVGLDETQARHVAAWLYTRR